MSFRPLERTRPAAAGRGVDRGRRLRRALSVLAAFVTAVSLTVVGPGAGTAAAAPTVPIAVNSATKLAEAQLLWQINADRARVGLPALAAQHVLFKQTDAWSTWMAAHGYLFHHPDLGAMATQAQPWGWAAIGENVGQGSDGLSLHRRFMASRPHRANVYGNYRSVGVGAVESGGRIWVTIRFLR